MSHKNRKTKFRPSAFEVLEDRAVPSTLGVSASATTNASNLQAELTQIDGQIDTAFSTFASTVFQAESGLQGTTTGSTGTTTGSTLSSLATTVNQAITTLETTLTSDISGSISNNALGLLQAQINSSTRGSLLSSMNEIINAANTGATNGTISSTTYPLLATAINGTISASFTSALVETYIYATGQASGNGNYFDLDQFSTQVNTAYTTFASSIYSAESTLFTTDGSSAPSSSTVSVVGTIDTQIGTLATSVGSLVAGTSEASRGSIIEAQFVGNQEGSLANQMNNLFVASVASDGSIAQAQLPLLTAAVDAAIAASYMNTSVDDYLLATS